LSLQVIEFALCRVQGAGFALLLGLTANNHRLTVLKNHRDMTVNRRLLSSTVCASLALLVWASPGRADLLFSGSSGTQSASAQFDLTGTTLTVTLTNTSSADVLVPTDVLTAVCFNTSHTLTPKSANLGFSSVAYGTLTNVGDGWGYGSGINAEGMNSAISATGAFTGLGHSNFSTANNALDGLPYGILSAGDNLATGNTGVTGHGPLIKESVQFVLTVAAGFTLSELGNTVIFQYGTASGSNYFSSNSGGPLVVAVPVPPSFALLAIGGCVCFVARRTRRRLMLAST
jgi:hypothetical protein